MDTLSVDAQPSQDASNTSSKLEAYAEVVSDDEGIKEEYLSQSEGDAIAINQSTEPVGTPSPDIHTYVHPHPPISSSERNHSEGIKPFDASQLISLNWSPLLTHIQNLTSFIEANQRKIHDITRRVYTLEEENKSLKEQIASFEKEEEKDKQVEDIKKKLRPMVKKWNDESKTHLEHQIHKLSLKLDKEVKNIQKSLVDNVSSLQSDIGADIEASKEQTTTSFEERLEEVVKHFEKQIEEAKEDMKVDLSGLIVEKKAEIVKETFDDSGLKEQLDKCRIEVASNTEAIKLLDEEFGDRVRRIVAQEMKTIKKTTVKTIMQQATTQTSKLKFYVRNLYALLRLDMKRLDEILSDYEIAEHKNPNALRESIMLQKKCSGVIIAPKPMLQSSVLRSGESGDTQPDTFDVEEDADIRISPGTVAALEYIYKKLPLHLLERKQVEENVEDVMEHIKKTFTESEEKINHQFAHVEKILESKVSKLLLSEALKDNDVILNIKDDFLRINNHVNNILETFMTREQIYSCLRLKADVTQMNLKADRKFLNGVFDYLNEKITLLSTETNNQQLLTSIKQLEIRLKDLNRSDAGMGSLNMSALDPISHGANDNSSALPGLNFTGATDQSVLGSTKCLSCNRPFAPNQKTGLAQKSKWQEYPPSSLPSLNLSSTMDSGRRLENYRHWLNGDRKNQVQHETEESFLGGGFKQLSPIKAPENQSSFSHMSGSLSERQGMDLLLDLSKVKGTPLPPNSARNIRSKINKDRNKSSSARPSTASTIPEKLKSKFDYTSMALGEA